MTKRIGETNGFVVKPRSGRGYFSLGDFASVLLQVEANVRTLPRWRVFDAGRISDAARNDGIYC